MSSSSTTVSLASGSSLRSRSSSSAMPDVYRERAALLTEVLELGELAVDLGLDVERLLALALTAIVARDHEPANLLAQGRIGLQPTRALRGEQLRDLGVDVARLLAAGDGAVGARLHHLPDLLLTHRPGDRGRGRARAGARLLFDREVALADLLQRAPGSR